MVARDPLAPEQPVRRPFIAGNWKMNTDRATALQLATGVAEGVTADGPVEVAVCVPFPHLGAVQQALSGTPVRLGAQHVYWEAAGAYTGEVSTAMLADYCSVVIIGHSERRQLFYETDESVNRRLRTVLESTLDPIVCVGETLAQRRDGETEDVLARQVASALDGLTLSPRITIAYEPVWAIGTGETATPEIAQEACAFIRGELAKFDAEAATAVRIQYGGSVNPGNAASLLSQPDIDGALVGGASLDAGQFLAIVNAARG
jgi:triosephosphate isomerase